MDRIETAAAVLKDINKFKKGELPDHTLVKSVCTFFDLVKNDEIKQQDLNFLKYISVMSGVPQFYDLLERFNRREKIENLDLNTLSSILAECTLHTSENNKVHKFQMQVLDSFEKGILNRFFLSASTSFGKTHLVYEIIKKMNYNNVFLIFPTIALLSENLERLISDQNYSYFKDGFSIHTLSEVKQFDERNIFIYTPERYLSFLDKFKDIKADFVFIDEVYKIDNEYLLDDQLKENERDLAYRLAVHYSLLGGNDCFLAGPYIDFSDPTKTNYNNSFAKFLELNKIKLLDYNSYELVNKSFTSISGKEDNIVDNSLTFSFKSKDKDRMLFDIIKGISSIKDNVIVYCPLRRQTESYSKKLVKAATLSNHSSESYKDFIDHISNRFGPEWSMIAALKNGVGIHHGLIPKYIQKEIVDLFNNGSLAVLISTTTITEGVNTSAKNLIVIDSKKGDKVLKKFDAKNISGRAGRFMKHYSGRVIALKNNFLEIIQSESDGIKHKNYDINTPKDEIDLYYTDNEFLTDSDKARRALIDQDQLSRNIPDFIFEEFKVISRTDKIILFDLIASLTPQELASIENLISILQRFTNITFEGFQVVLNTIRPIVKNEKLQGYIDRMILRKDTTEQYSLLSSLTISYLRGGFIGSVQFKQTVQKMKLDAAIRETADFVYNTLKYQVVKYLGVFNIMYKYHVSITTGISYEKVDGLEILLTKLEYNALSESGRMASDYGVPSIIVDHYEKKENSGTDKFDNYEKRIFDRIEKIIKK